MEGKPIKNDFNRHSSLRSAIEERGKTDTEARALLSNYQKVAEDHSKDEKFMKQLENRYLSSREENHAAQGIQLANLEQSARLGLNRAHDREIVLQNLNNSLHVTRDKILKEAKVYYHANYSLTKEFNDGPRKPKDRER